MGKSTISMVIFHSKLLVYQRVVTIWLFNTAMEAMALIETDDKLPANETSIYFSGVSSSLC